MFITFGSRSIHLKSVYFVPEGSNLLSLNRLGTLGVDTLISSGNLMTISDSSPKEIIVTLAPRNHVYHIECAVLAEREYRRGRPFVMRPRQAKKAVDGSESMLWHFRLGHLSLEAFRNLKAASLVPKHVKPYARFCEPCVQAKLVREKIPRRAERRRGSAQSPCERLHADLVGPDAEI